MLLGGRHAGGQMTSQGMSRLTLAMNTDKPIFPCEGPRLMLYPVSL